MRFTFTLFALSAVASSTAYAAIIGARQPNVPECAATCVQSGLSATSCNVGDDACLCNDTTFVNNVSSCVQASCSASDIQAAEAAFNQICGAAAPTASA